MLFNWAATLADVIDPGFPEPPVSSVGITGVIAAVCIAVIAAVIYFVKKM